MVSLFTDTEVGILTDSLRCSQAVQDKDNYYNKNKRKQLFLKMEQH